MDQCEVRSVADGDTAQIFITGEVDLASRPVIQSAVEAQLQDSHILAVMIDLTDVTFLDSTGIGALIGFRHRADELGRELTIRGAHGQVKKSPRPHRSRSAAGNTLIGDRLTTPMPARLTIAPRRTFATSSRTPNPTHSVPPTLSATGASTVGRSRRRRGSARRSSSRHETAARASGSVVLIRHGASITSTDRAAHGLLLGLPGESELRFRGLL